MASRPGNYDKIDRKRDDDNKCCSKRLLKTIVLFLNMIIIFIAIAVICGCGYLIQQRNNNVALLMGEIYYAPTYIILLCAVVTLFTCIFGFVAIIQSNTRLQFVYVILLSTLLFLELVGLLLAIALSQVVFSNAESHLNTTMINSYEGNTQLREATNVMHQLWKCCGVTSYHDWTLVAKYKDGNDVPISCCISPADTCGTFLHPSNIYYEGCMERFSKHLKSHALQIILVAGVAVLCELIIVAFAGLLLRSVRRENLNVRSKY